MKGYKGFEKGLVCRGKQYAENTVFDEENAVICHSGMHFCELPHAVFEHYSPGENHEFAVVESLDEPKTDDDLKYCCKSLKVGAKISVFDMVKISVSAFFEKHNFSGRIAEVKKVDGAANAGNRGAANAGDCGAAIVQKKGAASVGENGVAIAMGTGGKVKGKLGAILVLTESDDYYNITAHVVERVDGERIKADTWYELKNGEFVEVRE